MESKARSTSIACITSQKAALLLKPWSTTAKQSSAHISSEIVKKADGDVFPAIFILLQAVNGSGAPTCWAGDTEIAGKGEAFGSSISSVSMF